MKLLGIAILIFVTVATSAVAVPPCPLPSIPPQPQGVVFPPGNCAPGSEWSAPPVQAGWNPNLTIHRKFRCFQNNVWLMIQELDRAPVCGQVQTQFEGNLYYDEVPVKRNGVVTAHVIVYRGNDSTGYSGYQWGGYVCDPPCVCGLALRSTATSSASQQAVGVDGVSTRRYQDVSCERINQIAARLGASHSAPISIASNEAEARKQILAGDAIVAGWGGQCPDTWSRSAGCMTLENTSRTSQIITIGEDNNGNTVYDYRHNSHLSTHEEVRVNPVDICADGSGEARAFYKESVIDMQGVDPAC